MVRTGGGGSHQQRKQTPRQPDSGRPETRVPDTDGGPGGTRACGLAVGFLAYRRMRAWKEHQLQGKGCTFSCFTK